MHRGEFSSREVDRVLLCEFHRAIFEGVRGHAGRLRARDFGQEYIVFGPHRSTHRAKVVQELDRVFTAVARGVRSCLENSDDPSYVASAMHWAVWTHAEVIRVHPFEDGNGRSGRALLTTLLVRFGLRPVPIEATKQEYLDVLEHYYVAGEIGPLLDLYVRLYGVLLREAASTPEDA